MVINGYHDVVEFMLPEWPGGKGWELLVDTNLPSQDDQPVLPFGHAYQVTGRSLLLLLLQPDGS